MKILVFSDSHGSVDPMVSVINKEHPDQILHLGDHLRDADALWERFSEISIVSVAGNCDGLSLSSNTLIREFAGIRFLLTHGHDYGVKTGFLRLTYAAMEAECDAALFGHTHIPFYEKREGVVLFNPGSCRGSGGTYGRITINDGASGFDILPTEF